MRPNASDWRGLADQVCNPPGDERVAGGGINPNIVILRPQRDDRRGAHRFGKPSMQRRRQIRSGRRRSNGKPFDGALARSHEQNDAGHGGGQGQDIRQRQRNDGAGKRFAKVGVSDFGEASDYGPETVDRRMAGRFDLRVQDMRNALAFATSDAHWSALTDKANVTLIGHSSGGATAALSVGAIFVGEDFRSWCRLPESKGDLGCNYIAGVPESYRLPSFGPWKIGRISRIVLMDPAAGPAMTDASLGTVHIPALVIGACHDDFLPYEAHAGKYLRALGEATGYPLTDTSGHFIFLDECDADIDVFGVSLCKDRPGADRRTAHQKLYAAIREFLER